jgi:3D (Asp-Asp-Asp) domain-containing protein
MIATQTKGREKQGGQMPFLPFGLGAFVAAFTLLTAVPLHADTFYSGAAVNSNGSVYSWGVSSACSMSSHTTHMSSTLTSPKGRQASGQASDGCYSEVDLYLALDSTDLGTYTVVSYSWAFCPVLGRWFWNGCQSQGWVGNLATITLTRQSLTSTSANGYPPAGSFGYTASGSGNIASYTTQNSTANPNTASITAPSNPGGQPTPGALATLTATYTAAQQTPSKSFPGATFGQSCYITALESDYGDPTQGTCSSVTYRGTLYSGSSTNPSGLPARQYCNSFLATMMVNGSGVLKDGTTKVKYVSGGYPSWAFTVVTTITGSDGTPIVAGQRLARDKSIIPGISNTHVQLPSGTYLANDTGGNVTGYRLDIYTGAGKANCTNYPNPIVVGVCDHVTSTCPGYAIQ